MLVLFVAMYLLQAAIGVNGHQVSNQNQRQNGGEMKVRKCEPIEIEMCRNLGYNSTGMPNLVGHESQQDAGQQVSTFNSLIQYGCSSKLKFFLCSAYFPICSEKVSQLIGPCAPVCESVRRRCEPILISFGFPWPLALNCSKFLPRNEDDSMCIDINTEDDEFKSSTTNQLVVSDVAPTPRLSSTVGKCEQFRNPTNYVYLNRTLQCALLCAKDDVFSSDQKMFADAWMSVWSGLCFVTTFIAILTFLIDMSRFVYPERALVCIAVCYNICSVSYLVRLIVNREAIACRAVPDSEKVVVQGGLENTECTFVFLLLYYFSMAGSIWWVILAALWFLNSGFDRSYESFARHGTLLHVVAWSVPAAAAIAVIVLRSVDADELTAMCHVGYRNQTTQLWFVLIPTGVFLLLGGVFLVAGFVCSMRTWKLADDTESDKTSTAVQSAARTSTIRIGVFLLVHVILTICILSIQCYEYVNRHHWPMQQLQDLGGDGGLPAVSAPNVTVLMFGVAANLTVGIVSAVWLWKGESLQSWQRFCSRLSRCCCCCCRTARSKQESGARKQAVASLIASSSDSNTTTRGQTPALDRSRPIYRVAGESLERNGRDHHSSTGPTFSSSRQYNHHHHRHHHYQFHRNPSPLLKTHSPPFPSPPPPPPPPPSCDKRSSRGQLQYRVFNSDITVL